MIFVKHCAIDQVSHVLLVALCKEQHCLGIPLGCLPETLALGVFSNAFKDGLDRTLQLLQPLQRLLRGRF